MLNSAETSPPGIFGIIKDWKTPADSWKTVRSGHSCAAVSSHDAPVRKVFFGHGQSTLRVGEGWSKGVLLGGRHLESEYLVAGFSPRIRRWLDCEKTSSQK